MRNRSYLFVDFIMVELAAIVSSSRPHTCNNGGIYLSTPDASDDCCLEILKRLRARGVNKNKNSFHLLVELLVAKRFGYDDLATLESALGIQASTTADTTMFFVFGLWTIRRLVTLSHPRFLSCCSEELLISKTWIRTTVFCNTNSALRPLKCIR